MQTARNSKKCDLPTYGRTGVRMYRPTDTTASCRVACPRLKKERRNVEGLLRPQKNVEKNLPMI